MNKIYKVGKISEWYSGQTYQLLDIKLKNMQIAIIKCNLLNDVLVNLPTGFGKSMLFQYPASKLFNECIIIFVPLRALLWDSIKEAQKLGISAAQINDETIQRYKQDRRILQMYFLTPQKLFINQNTRSFVETLHEMNKIKKFVIDQAHCVSQWGSDFRPCYLQLKKLRMMFPNVKILAMSATIPPEAFEDLICQLSMYNCIYFQASFNRPNLTYLIRQTTKSQVGISIKNFLNQQSLFQQCGIIYCQTIKFASEVHSQLSQLGLKCALFHSKISQKKRWQIFKKFMNEEIKIIVATICFGMGVNKKNIRYVINAGISMTMENYYQESGRAGRDGKPASCLLLSYPKDESALVFLTQQSIKDKKMRQRKTAKIYIMKQYVKSLECRKKFMFKQLGQKFTQQECNQSCDFCLNKQLYNDKFYILKQDVTEDCKKIVKQLQKNDKYFTKNQLCSLLKGNQVKPKKNKVSISTQLLGIFKSKDQLFIETLVSKLISLKVLVQFNPGSRGKFAKFNKYYKICKKPQLNLPKNIQIQMKKQKKLAVFQGKTKSSNQLIGDRFQKFISNKKVVNKDAVDQSALQMKQVNQAKILKSKENLSFLQELFDDEQNNQTEVQVQKQQKQYQFRDNFFGGSINSNSIIQISSSDLDQQQQFEDNKLLNNQYDKIDNQGWDPSCNINVNDHQQQLQMESQQKVFKKIEQQIKLKSDQNRPKSKQKKDLYFQPIFTSANNLKLLEKPSLNQKSSFQQTKVLKKTNTVEDKEPQLKKQLKKQPSIFESLKINIPKAKFNKKLDFI